MSYAYYQFEDHRVRYTNDDLTACNAPEVPKRPLAEIVELVERKLAWIGLDPLNIAQICVTDNSLQIELSNHNELASRMEVDRITGAITRYDGHLSWDPTC